MNATSVVAWTKRRRPSPQRSGFRRLWFGQTVSDVGDQVTLVALPTVALLVLRVTPFQLGLLGTIGTLSYPLLGLVAGVWVDRVSRRRILMAADLIRLLAIGSLPLAAVIGTLRFGQMLVVAGVMGSAAVFFDVGYQAYLPSLVAERDLVTGNARMEMSASTAQVAGPSIAGFLIEFAGAANALIVDAASYLTSVASLLMIREREQPPDRPRHSLIPDARAGLRIVFRHRLLFRLILTSAGANLGRGLALELFILYAYRGLKFSPGTAGAILAGGAAATLLGAALCTRIAGRFGLGRTLVFASVVKGLPWLASPLALTHAPIPTMAAIMFVSSFFLPIWNVNNVSLRQYLTDAALLGRVSATARTISWATVPLSALLGGVLAQVGVEHWGNRLGLAIVLALGGAVWTASTLILPIRGLSAVSGPQDAARIYGRATEAAA